MFTVPHREAVTVALVAMAEADDEVSGAAFVGSSATGIQDAWSDIDLMLQLAQGADEVSVIESWTQRLYSDFNAVHHLDVRAGNGVLYRVFLTAESLQIDISFWPHTVFRATGERFRLIFGTPNDPDIPAGPSVNSLIGEAWLFAIHVRSALARNTPFYAASLLDTMRIRVMELASIHHGLNPHQRREVDMLPADLLKKLEQTMPTSVRIDAIQDAFGVLMDIYRTEIEHLDPALADGIDPALAAIASERTAV